MAQPTTKHLFLDFETASQDPKTAAAIDVSVATIDFERFTSSNPYDVDAILANTERFKLSVEDQAANYGFKVSKSTMEWWLKQTKIYPEIANRIKPSKTDLTVVEFREQFLAYIEENGPYCRFWSRANTFDPIILERLFGTDIEKIRKILPHWNVRDVRTFIDAKLGFHTQNDFVPIQDPIYWDRIYKKHCSEWDIVADVLRFQLIARSEAGIEPPYVDPYTNDEIPF